jgi:hypothetical protein
MTRRSVSNDVGRFGKINIVENVGKMLKHQIVDDSAWLVDRPFLARSPSHAMGIWGT